MILRRRALVVATVIVVELIMLAFALTRPLTYTSVVSFMPEGQRSVTSVTSLAMQLGVNIGASPDGLSAPQFYPELIRSPQFVEAVLDSGRFGGKPLVEQIGIRAADPRVRRALSVQNLQKNIVPTVAQRTGVVTVSVTAAGAELATTIAAGVLTEVTRFNQHTRQGRAAAERQFIERRIAEVRDSLRAAEERLLRFKQANRDISRSTTLPLEQQRLEREVASQEALLSTLGPSYEQARIEEIRDTPVLTILRRPEAPLWPNPRGRVRLLALGLVGGLGLGVIMAIAIETWRALRGSQSSEAQELSAIISALKTDARRGRLVAVLFGGNGRS